MKKFKSMIILLGLSVLLSGCGNLNAQQTLNAQKNISEKQEVQVTEMPQENLIKENNQGLKSPPDLSDEQRQTPDFVGEISEIIGNEMIIKEVNMPQMSQIRQTPEQVDPQQNEADQSEEKTQPKAITGSTDVGFQGGGLPGGGMPGGGMPGARRGGEGQTTNTREKSASVRSNLKLEYTGEERTIMIPVGMNITGGRGQGEITFETLQEGNVISIWLDDTEGVERVSLIGGQQNE